MAKSSEEELLEKFKDGTLTMEEAYELREILENKLDLAKQNRDAFSVLIIGLMYSCLNYLIVQLELKNKEANNK